MEYELIAVSDTDPAWNPVMEAWWNSGGAMLWNQYGGFGKDRLVMSVKELESFMEQAGGICGWQPGDPGNIFEAGPGNPLIITPHAMQDTSHLEEQPQSFKSTFCCRDCGRPWHEALNSEGNSWSVEVPCRYLNHVLNSLQEAIAFSRGQGPNNAPTWEAALEELVASIKAQIKP